MASYKRFKLVTTKYRWLKRITARCRKGSLERCSIQRTWGVLPCFGYSQHNIQRCIRWLKAASLNKQWESKYWWFSIPYNTALWGRIVSCTLQKKVQTWRKGNSLSLRVSLACSFTAWPNWLLSVSCGPPTQTRTLASSDEVCCISGKARQNVREYRRNEKEIRYLPHGTDWTEGL